jgi:hypothetical protein
VLLEESRLNDEVFQRQIIELVTDDAKRMQISDVARKLGDVHRNCSIAQVIDAAAESVAR